MRRTALLLPVAALLFLGPACGGSSSPSTPSPTPRPTPTPTPANQPVAPAVIDGWSEAALQAEANPATVSSGDRVTVSAPGYLTREQAYSGAPIALHMMYAHRSPGNRHPDTDVGLAAGAGSRVVVIRD